MPESKQQSDSSPQVSQVPQTHTAPSMPHQGRAAPHHTHSPTRSLFQIQTPYVEAYLKRKTQLHSGNVEALDMLWKYYEKIQNFPSAAKILSQLAERHRYCYFRVEKLTIQLPYIMYSNLYKSDELVYHQNFNMTICGCSNIMAVCCQRIRKGERLAEKSFFKNILIDD